MPTPNPVTFTVLGCGRLGTAILSGILSHTSEFPPSTPFELPSQLIPTRFFACVQSAQSAARVKSAVSDYLSFVTVVINENARAVERAEVILLACRPSDLVRILEGNGIRQGLKGKLLISVVGGFTADRIREILWGSSNNNNNNSNRVASKKITTYTTSARADEDHRCQIICAMPNVAATIGSSMTIITEPAHPLPEKSSDLIIWILSRIGDVKFVAANHMDVSTILCAGGPAFVALFLEALASTVMVAGVRKEDAMEMAARTMQGVVELVLDGEKPDVLRKKVSTPGGFTVEGLRVLEEGGLKELVVKAAGKSLEKLQKFDVGKGQ